MGSGYWILVWDGWGIGLDMINPRFLGGEQNSFSSGGERWSDEKIDKHHNLSEYAHWRVIRSEAYLEDAHLPYVAEHLARRLADTPDESGAS